MAKPARRSATPRRKSPQVADRTEDFAPPAGGPAGDATASPIEVLLGTMRALWQASRDAAGAVVDAKTAAAAAGLAKDAAPYVHPRLATIEPPERDLSQLSDAALEERIRALLRPEHKEP